MHVLLHDSVIPPVIAGLATLSAEGSVDLCRGARACGLLVEVQIARGQKHLDLFIEFGKCMFRLRYLSESGCNVPLQFPSVMLRGKEERNYPSKPPPKVQSR